MVVFFMAFSLHQYNDRAAASSTAGPSRRDEFIVASSVPRHGAPVQRLMAKAPYAC
jgi:hypothetical protein